MWGTRTFANSYVHKCEVVTRNKHKQPRSKTKKKTDRERKKDQQASTSSNGNKNAAEHHHHREESGEHRIWFFASSLFSTIVGYIHIHSHKPFQRSTCIKVIEFYLMFFMRLYCCRCIGILVWFPRSLVEHQRKYISMLASAGARLRLTYARTGSTFFSRFLLHFRFVLFRLSRIFIRPMRTKIRMNRVAFFAPVRCAVWQLRK